MTSARGQANSQSLADEAHLALRAGELARARVLFADAARAEAEEFDAVPENRPRTLGVLAVSTTALWFKAGDYRAAELFAYRALANASLPSFAQWQVREILQSSWSAQAARGAGIAATPGQTLELHGNLRALDLDQGSMRLLVEGAPVRIFGVGDTLDMRLGAMVNQDVDVRVIGGDQGDLHFVEIAQSPG